MVELVWVAWYDNGEIFHSSNSVWEFLPDDGLQYLWVKHGEVNRSLYGNDYYFRAESSNGYIFGSNNGPPSDIRERYQKPIIKRGRWMEQKAFDELVREAREYGR